MIEEDYQFDAEALKKDFERIQREMDEKHPLVLPFGTPSEYQEHLRMLKSETELPKENSA